MSAARPDPPPRTAPREAEATLLQQGMWVTEQTTGAGTAYHMPLLVHLRGDLDADALTAACAAVVERHPALGSVVAETGGGLRLVPGAPVPVRRRPADGPIEGDPDDWPEAVREEVFAPFDVDGGPLARFTLYRTGPGRHTLAFVAHHLVFDGHSKDILVADLAALYNGGRPAPPPALDHGRAERERVAAELPAAREFWAGHWREPGETVVRGRALRSRRAAAGRTLRFRADLAPVAGLTRFETLLAALHTLLAGYGNDGVTTAVDLSTRPAETAGHIGVFVNELPVASRPGPEETFGGFAARLRAGLREVYRFRRVPLSRALPRLRPHAALAPVSVSYRARTLPDPVFTGLDCAVDRTVPNGSVRGALHLQCADGPDGLAVALRHDPAELPEARPVADDLRLLLERAGRDPGLRLRDLAAPR
ncbi:nonribosomal peptide synthase [Planomonospora sphaerica]|uniref:Nonribosomal peptide synthase n=1 Tax=Planomonospora sphaerica TaxID=161355 RepID=A0A161LJX1_9ACTN|nr:condensation domain-containing protein [Planomonospora sphaerica]GAT66855.1 nonribosomal peptide synthase [Planomonospora sphaerica]